MSGFSRSIWDWSVVDEVAIPEDLEPGDYLLSWRWDCEQSDQVFQNCADITISISGDNTQVQRIVLDPLKRITDYRGSQDSGSHSSEHSKNDDHDANRKPMGEQVVPVSAPH